jgi:hypothetical protein
MQTAHVVIKPILRYFDAIAVPCIFLKTWNKKSNATENRIEERDWQTREFAWNPEWESNRSCSEIVLHADEIRIQFPVFGTVSLRQRLNQLLMQIGPIRR